MTARPSRIDQFISASDASDQRLLGVFSLQKFLRARGYYSEVFVDGSARFPNEVTHPMASYENFYKEEAMSIYHHSRGSNLPDFLLAFDLYRISILHELRPLILVSEAETPAEWHSLQLAYRQKKKVRILSNELWLPFESDPNTVGAEPPLHHQHRLVNWLPEYNSQSDSALGHADVDKALSSSKKTILSVAPLSYDQGTHFLLQTLKLYTQHVKDDVRLVCVGIGNKAYQKKVMRLCQELELTVASGMAETYAERAHVIFQTTADAAQMNAIYKKSHIFASCADFIANPYAVLFAFQAGLPVVGTQHPYLQAILGIENGLLIPKAPDPSALVEAWAAALNQEALKKALSLASKKRSSVYSQESQEQNMDRELALSLSKFQEFHLRKN